MAKLDEHEVTLILADYNFAAAARDDCEDTIASGDKSEAIREELAAANGKIEGIREVMLSLGYELSLDEWGKAQGISPIAMEF